MNSATIDHVAQIIRTAERTATPHGPLHEEFSELDPAAAYAVQEAYAGLRSAAGHRLTGRKIGCTNEVVQRSFGIDTPDYGHLFDTMLVPNGGQIDLSRLIAPRVEAEIAFILSVDLAGPHLTPADVRAATEAVVPALEIIDSRITDWRITFVDTVADNGSSALYVLGDPVPYNDALDLLNERVRLRNNSEELDTGLGSAALGDPAAAVAWLANAISEYGRGLRAGEHVLSGSITRTVPVEPSQTYEAVFENLGAVTCTFS